MMCLVQVTDLGPERGRVFLADHTPDNLKCEGRHVVVLEEFPEVAVFEVARPLVDESQFEQRDGHGFFNERR